MKKSDDILSDEQKSFIDNNISKITDLIEMTRAVFMDESLDGRTKEGRAVRSYLIKKGEQFSTTKSAPAKKVTLTEEHKEFIKEYSKDGTNAYQIAKIIFPEEDITPLSKQTTVIAGYIREEMPENITAEDSAKGLEYSPPASILSAVKKINKSIGAKLDIEKLTRAETVALEFLKNVLSSPRFLYQINSYSDIFDRNLFRSLYGNR